MITRPYELLARFGADGKVVGVHTKTLTTIDGREYEGSPQPLSGTTDAAFTSFAASFSAAVVAERDQLRASLQTADAAITTLQEQLAAGTTQNAALQAQVDTIAGLQEQIATLTADLAAVTVQRDQTTIDLTDTQASLAAAVAQAADLTTVNATLTARVAELELLVPPPAGPREVTPEEFADRFSVPQVVAIQMSPDPMVVYARSLLQTRSSRINLDAPKTKQLVGGLVAAEVLTADEAAQILS